MAPRGATLIVVALRFPLLLSVLVTALLAAACGGGASDTGAAPAADAGADTSVDGEEATPADADTDGTAEAPTDEATSENGSTEVEAADWPHTFVADQIGGGQIDANDLAGRDVVLWFWAPW